MVRLNGSDFSASELQGIIKHAVDEALNHHKAGNDLNSATTFFKEEMSNAVDGSGKINITEDEFKDAMSSVTISFTESIKEGKTIEDSISSALVDIGLSDSFSSNISSQIAESLDEDDISEQDILDNLNEPTVNEPTDSFATPSPDDLEDASQAPDTLITANPEESPPPTGDESNADAADLTSLEQEQVELEEQEQQEQEGDDIPAEDDDYSSIT